ncbi:flagellar FlbD family protein [Halobacillus naozhouensis]|uniref:Flagellar FlbD family protein n=1 Tax=Halobacillus naozhouensis TaxID=554880 RepID=A0ABY8J2L9_9BACI|nr:flagellar FlbD family protein [Halobacillus naozhouensis]WFT76743.1 flagellar FlbD family protein [Halobacillus naozhouensis]
MISLTRLNGEGFWFNAIYIERIQSNPDTTITTTHGKRFVVKEQEEIVIKKMKHFYREIGLLRAVNKAGDSIEE